MHCRLFLVFLLLYSISGIANDSAWNCQQSKDGKEWICVGADKPAETPAQEQTPPQEQSASPAPANQPAVTTPVKEPEPQQATPVVKPEPALAKPAPSEPLVKPEPAVEQVESAPAATTVEQQAEPGPLVKPDDLTPSVPQAGKPEFPTPALPDTEPETRQANATKGLVPGWDCQVREGQEKWDCSLVGQNPKSQSQPKAITVEAAGWRLLDPAYTPAQEQTFRALLANLKYDPWENCGVAINTLPEFLREKHLREVSPLDVRSDYSETFDNEVGVYVDNVQIHRADQRASSTIANYDAVSETLDLQGNVYYSEDELSLYSDSASLRLNSDQARLRNVLFISPTTPLRGEARAAYRDSKSLSHYSDVAYTSCQPGNQDWIVHATDLKINRERGRGAAKNAWVEFKGVPVFYSPFLSFPTDNRRISGFLAPNFGNTQRSGFNLTLPYYWNIAPNYDLLFRPRYLSDRGILLGGDFRYLTEDTKGKLSLEVLPNDDKQSRARYLGVFKHRTEFVPGLSANFDATYASDRDYFADLGNALSINNFSFLYSKADLTYVKPNTIFIAQIDNYQTIDRAITPPGQPYRRLPQVIFNTYHSFNLGFTSLDTALESEYVHFQQNVLVNAQRINVKPALSLPFQNEGAFVRPKLSLQVTEYELSQGVLAGDSIFRALPIASVDSGLFFERNFTDSGYLSTIEPRLFYLYIPSKDQNNIPLFDTSINDFVFNSLFRENRFSGNDRVQDANQLTAAVTTRLTDTKTGRERLKFSVGEIFYFDDRNVSLCGIYTTGICFQGNPFTVAETTSQSNLVSELSTQISEHVSAQLGVQWNPDTNEFERNEAAIHFQNNPGEVVNLGWRYRHNPLFADRRNDIVQSDVSFRWPVYNDWYAVGRWQYSWLFNATREGFLGVQKETCCWRLSILGRRYVNNTVIVNPQNVSDINAFVEGVSQTGVFVQFELKGLTGLGQKLDDFFEENIYGYINPDRR
ncbi:MAG: LPS biosynthesis protein [Methylobacter sp.]|nr:MAG: LPS biosynthesis protein [Methylobacter sp.]